MSYIVFLNNWLIDLPFKCYWLIDGLIDFLIVLFTKKNDFSYIENRRTFLYIEIFFSNLEKIFLYIRNNQTFLYIEICICIKMFDYLLYIEIFFQDMKYFFLYIEMSSYFLYMKNTFSQCLLINWFTYLSVYWFFF